MLEYFPYIGGDAASGTKNLTEAYILVAMGEALRRYGTSMEQIGYLMVCVYERNLGKISKFIRRIMRRMFTNKKLLTKMFLKKDMILVITISYALLPILQKNMAMVSICRIYVILTMLCSDCCEFRFLGNIHVLRMEITVILS